MFANGKRLNERLNILNVWNRAGNSFYLLQYNFIDTSHFFPLSSSQRSFLVLLKARRVHVNPIKRDFKSLLVIRNGKEIQRLNESNKFYRVSLFPGMEGTDE